MEKTSKYIVKFKLRNFLLSMKFFLAMYIHIAWNGRYIEGVEDKNNLKVFPIILTTDI